MTACPCYLHRHPGLPLNMAYPCNCECVVPHERMTACTATLGGYDDGLVCVRDLPHTTHQFESTSGVPHHDEPGAES